MKHTLKLLALSLLAVSVLTLIKAPSASAASLTVSTDTNPSTCTLDEAIENINDQARNNTDCVEIDAYGTNDTITIPEGTVLLTADLPQITESVTITGAGMGETVIDGDGQWQAIEALLTSGDFTLIGITVTAYNISGVRVRDAENTTISEVEVDGGGTASTNGFLLGIGVLNNTSYESTVNLSDIYIHDFNVDVSNILQGLAVGTSGQSEMNIKGNRITVARMHNTSATQTVILGAIDAVNGGSPFAADISNITVSDASSEGSLAFGIALINIGNTNLIPVLNIANATIDKIESSESFPLEIPSLGIFAAVENDGETAQATINATNVLISQMSGGSINCGVVDLGPFYGGNGTGTGTITSTGGNLSDDTTCSPYFTNPTDQNNLTNLSSTLGTLSNNGGFVPTIPLLQGSPAIDSGVTVPSLTTDARLAVRPQGTAYDSGAYESPFSKAVAVSALASTGESAMLYSFLAGSLVLIGSAVFFTRRFGL